MQFALLEHRQAVGVHWDFLAEVSPTGRLLTWRLASNPLTASGAIESQVLPPHRRVYLDYQGPISGGRGVVSRLDRGQLDWLLLSPGHWRFMLRGETLTGNVEIVALPRGIWKFNAKTNV
jgi:hypothetical protein